MSTLLQVTITNSPEVDLSGIPEEHRSSYDPDKGWCLYVSNLPRENWKQTHGEVKKVFQSFGAVRQVMLPLRGDKKIFRGFAFVHMDNYAEACEALKNVGNFEIDQREMKVKFRNAPLGEISCLR